MGDHMGTDTRWSTQIKINIVRGFWNLSCFLAQHTLDLSPILGKLSCPGSISKCYSLWPRWCPGFK